METSRPFLTQSWVRDAVRAGPCAAAPRPHHRSRLGPHCCGDPGPPMDLWCPPPRTSGKAGAAGVGTPTRALAPRLAPRLTHHLLPSLSEHQKHKSPLHTCVYVYVRASACAACVGVCTCTWAHVCAHARCHVCEHVCMLHVCPHGYAVCSCVCAGVCVRVYLCVLVRAEACTLCAGMLLGPSA